MIAYHTYSAEGNAMLSKQQVDFFNANGRPRHQNGIAAEPGIYFLGLPWLTMRGSSFIWGVWEDAAMLAAHIVKRNGMPR